MSTNVEREPGISYDSVINHIFGAGLSIAAVLGRQQLDDDVTRRLHAALAALDDAVAELRADALARVFPAGPNATRPEASHVLLDIGHLADRGV